MKRKIIINCFIVFLLLEILILKSSGTIITKYDTKQVWNGKQPIYRDLIMLSSLAYEDLPKGCVKGSDGAITNNCIFAEGDIEGLSKTKLLEMTRTPSAGIEDGQKYYYSNMGTVDELKDWKVVDNEVVSIPFNGNKLEKEVKFVAYTFNKGNNYIITYRGSEFPDVLEWGQDVSYAIKRVNSMSPSSENYAVKMYNRISSSCSTCSIYITGHSLGGYLAQVAAAKLVGNSYNNGVYNKNKFRQLSQVVYFNGIGVNAISSIDNSYENEVNARISNLKQLGLYSERLILYTIKGDAVSSIGDHYGEIRQLKAAANVKRTLNSIVYNDEDSDNATTWLSNLYSKLQVAYDNNISNADTVAKMTKQNFNSLKFVLDLSTNKYSISKFNGNGITNGLTGIPLVKSTISSSMSEYGVNNIAELFSITHETDSFLCITQDNRGTVPNVTIRGASRTGTHINDEETDTSVFYTNGENNVVLTATVTGGCVQNYQWQKCNSGGGCSNITNANSSQYTINKNTIKSDQYYKVVVYYDDTYLQGKLVNDSYVYTQKNSINKYLSSETYKIIYDVTPPSCSFETQTMKICRGSTGTTKIKCSDNKGMSNIVSTLNLTPFSLIYLFDSEGFVENDKKIPAKFYGSWPGTVTISIKDVEDYAGNKSKKSPSYSSLELTVERTLFNSEC